MISEEALIGARVRVGESGWRSEWHGLTGTITAKWGNPEHLAFDVRLDDGRTQLFWHHELEGVAEGAYQAGSRPWDHWRALRKEKSVQRAQSVSEMADEILLARQAMALVRRSDEPLIETLEDILKTPAVSQPSEPMGGPDQEDERLLLLSFGYYLDESDPDILVLRRQDGSHVAAFSAIGATRESIVEAAREDYAALVGENADHPAPSYEKRHSA